MANDNISYTPNYNLATVAEDQNKVIFKDFRTLIAGTNNSNMEKIDNILKMFAIKLLTYGFKGYYDNYADLISEHPVGNAGDSYIVNSSVYTWDKNTNTWLKVSEMQGEQGEQGIQGEQGVQGEQGSVWISGTSTPDSASGRVGDWYLNTSDYHLFEKISDTVWVDFGSIRGEKGNKGTGLEYDWQDTSLGVKKEDETTYTYVDLAGKKGEKGDPGKDGTGVTINGSYNSYADLITNHPTGVSGDSYLINGDLYVWSDTAVTWINVGRIQGEQGVQGVQGIQGEQGLQGEQGSVWISGTSTPDSASGRVGDWYVNTSTWQVYEKTSSSTWTLKGVIRGEKGDKGDKGEKGDPGDSGEEEMIIYSGTCPTAGATLAKIVNTTRGDFKKVDGAMVIVMFSYAHTASSTSTVTLNIDGTGSSPIGIIMGAAPRSGYIVAYTAYLFRYNATENMYFLINPTYETAINDKADRTDLTGKLNKAGDTATGNIVSYNPSPTTSGMRNIYAGTSEMVSGTTPLATGVIYFQYEFPI